MKELINLTYELEQVSCIFGIKNDKAIGQFVIDNDLHEDITKISETSLYLLDKEKIGYWQRQNDDGVFVDNYYVVTAGYEPPEIYDGEHLPETVKNDDCVFRLKIAEAPVNDSSETEHTAEWITLPIDKAEANRIARTHNEGRIEDCVFFDFYSPVPQIDDEMYRDMLDFDKLNGVAALVGNMSVPEQIKYKAALRAERAADIDTALDIAEHLPEYELAFQCADECEYFREYLLHHLDTRMDARWLDGVQAQAAGFQLIKQLGATATEYGVVSARSGSLFEIVPFEHETTISEEDDMQMEGMEL